MQRTEAHHTPPPRGRGTSSGGAVSATLHALSTVLVTLVGGLLLAIAIQCAGLRWWWPEEGSRHALTMLQTELGYLEEARTSIVSADPMAFAARAAALADEWLWQKTGAAELVAWVAASPPPGASDLRFTLHAAADALHAVILTTQVVAVRVAVLLLALPVFGLFGVVGVVDGLVERDIRRWSGGRESSMLFHLARSFVTPAIMLSWLIYLCVPVALPPAFIVLPFAGLFAAALRTTLATFKKYV